jgi:hypothetical protein
LRAPDLPICVPPYNRVMVPDGFDPDRWVLVARRGHSPERCLLGGNAHTHYGRMHAWCVDHERFTTISKADIIDGSPAALAWVDGFLVGSEPDLHEYLGITGDEAGLIDRDDPAFARWRADVAAARGDGWLPFLHQRPVTPVPAEGEHLEPWCWVGGEFWQWRDGGWSVVAAAPAGWDGSSLAPSICDARSHHDLAMYGVWAICMDCGNAMEMEAEDVSDSDDGESTSATP